MRRGSALVLTLWCVAVLSVTIVTVARVVELDVEAASLQTRRVEARELALSGVALGLNAKIRRDDPLLFQEFEDGSRLQVSLQSENARINVNRALRRKADRTLPELFALWEVPDEAVRITVDSLRDWVDENDVRSLNGAEREDLQGQTQYSIPENRDFHSVAEMERVRGMEAVVAANPNWDEMFSVFSTGKIDLQDAPVDLLRAVAGLSIEQALRLIEVRNGPDFEPNTEDDYYFESTDDAAIRAGVTEVQRQAMEQNFAVGTEPTRIVSVGEVGGIRSEITVVVNRGGGEGAAEILTWEER